MLYVIATPIGNISDISQRAIDVLSKVDFVLCEDTRRTRQLYSALNIPTPQLFSYHAHNEEQKLGWAISKIKNGEVAGLVSDAGTPIISDPGMRLVAASHQNDVDVRVIPGPCSVVSALCVSGFDATPFHFLGFPPRKKGAQTKWIINASRLPGTLVLFESGKRIGDLIANLQNILPNRKASLCRELTKLHEQIICLPLSELPTTQQKGEIVLIVGPGEEYSEKPKPLNSLKDISAALSNLWGVSKREAYNILVKNKP